MIRLVLLACLACLCQTLAYGQETIPREPVEIGFEPQFVFDQYIVDNRWALKQEKQAVLRVLHQPVRNAGNPVMKHGDPSNFWVVRDAGTGLFRMYYQANVRVDGDGLPDTNQETLPGTKGRKFRTGIGYAQSKDGIRWDVPDLNLYPRPGYKPNNLVIGRSDRPDLECDAPCILEGIPQEDRRGYRYLMLYRAKGSGGGQFNGIRLIGSKDGVHWDEQSDTLLARVASDNHNTVSYDPRSGKYLMSLRAKHIYLAGQEGILNTGESRRAARMFSPDLWTDWMAAAQPQQVLQPDELDAAAGFNRFYGMPTRYHAGIFWGFLFPFRGNDDMYTELTWSRDGTQFERLPARPRLMELGPEGSWDDMMVKVRPCWVEVGDKWHIYYEGWDGPHRTAERNGGVGLATIRKEGFVSLRGPEGGGVVCTRQLVWPKGGLFVNADASKGELSVRISDEARRPIEGFDYEDCDVFRGDSVSQEIRWKGRSLSELAGRTLRLEIQIRNTDLYTFRAKSK